jgi:hypothetical protein
VKSVDQLVADQIAASSPTQMRSLHLGVLPADSLMYYQRAGRSTFFFAPKPVDYEANPVTAFDKVFAGGGAAPPPPPMTGGMPAADFTNDALDMVDAEIGEIGNVLRDSAVERSKLDQHRLALKDLRVPVAGAPAPTMPPAMSPAMNRAAMPSVEKLRPSLQGKASDAYKSQYFSDIFDAQVDILARALVTGMTRVGTLQAGSADGNPVVPVDRGYPHHNTSHGNQGIFSRCQQWYSTKFARLLQALDVPDPLDPTGKTVLYNSLIVMMAECLPVSHSSTDVPVLLAGNAGGALRAGVFVTANTNNKVLMATVLTMLKTPTAHFGSQTIAELRV